MEPEATNQNISILDNNYSKTTPQEEEASRAVTPVQPYQQMVEGNTFDRMREATSPKSKTRSPKSPQALADLPDAFKGTY